MRKEGEEGRKEEGERGREGEREGEGKIKRREKWCCFEDEKKITVIQKF